jgi:hypothetical protein
VSDRLVSGEQTFFDIGIDGAQPDDSMAWLESVVDGASKQRISRNHNVVAYLRGEPLSDDNRQQAEAVLDGSLWGQKASGHTNDHCTLCSERFVRIDLPDASEASEHWNVCRPTTAYYPGGLMTHMPGNRCEDLQAIEDTMFEDLITTASNLLGRLESNPWEDCRFIGLNVLFQQISKSQACIHGHVEPMIANAHSQNIGVFKTGGAQRDPTAAIVNETAQRVLDSAQRKKVIWTPDGCRWRLDDMSIQETQTIIDRYQTTQLDVIQALRRGLRTRALHGRALSPAPVLNAYLTLYRGERFVSLAPEVTLPIVPLHEIDESEEAIYCLKIDESAKPEERLLSQRAPIIKPSIKVRTPRPYASRIANLERHVLGVLGVGQS